MRSFCAAISVFMFLGPLSVTAQVGSSAQRQSVAGSASNILYVEAGGSATLGSLNYERIINQRWRARIGFTAFAFGFVERTEFYGPVFGAAYTKPIRSWAAREGGVIEVGAAFTVLEMITYEWFSGDADKDYRLVVAPQVGYSYRPIRGGLYIRLSATPLIYWEEPHLRALPWGGLSMGLAF